MTEHQGEDAGSLPHVMDTAACPHGATGLTTRETQSHLDFVRHCIVGLLEMLMFSNVSFLSYKKFL